MNSNHSICVEQSKLRVFYLSVLYYWAIDRTKIWVFRNVTYFRLWLYNIPKITILLIIKNRNYLPFSTTWVHRRFFNAVLVAHFPHSFPCCVCLRSSSLVQCFMCFYIVNFLLLSSVSSTVYLRSLICS